MALKSQFGSLPPVDFFDPPQKKGGGFLHNLLKDAIDTAKGIPFGMVELVRNPVKSVKAVGESYGDMYGGGWDNFKTQFMAHPLQPLLDAISVPLILAGGLGVAVKGASTAANLGRTARFAETIEKASELAKAGRFAEADAMRASAMRAPRLDAAAQHFRKGTTATTRMVDVPDMPGTSLPFAYSSNLFRRSLTRGWQGLVEGVSPTGTIFSKEGLGKRLLAKEEAKRAAATAARGKGQAAVLVGARKHELSAEEAGNALADNLEHGLIQGALKVDADKAEALANSETFSRGWEFIYKKDSEMWDAEIYEPGTGPGMVDDIIDGEATLAPEELGRAQQPQLMSGREPLGPDRQLMPPPKGTDLVERRGLERLRPEESVSGAARSRTSRGTPADEGPIRTKIEVREEGPGTREHTLGGFSDDQIKEFIHTMAERVKTGNDHKMALVQDGKVLIVRKGVKDKMSRELDDSARLANKIYRAPVAAWKGIILGLSPRYFVNNVIGNAGMYAAATNPVEFTRGVLHAIRSTRGNRAAARAAREMEVTVDSLMKKYLPDDWIHARAGFMQHGPLGLDQTVGFRLKNPIKRAAHARLYTLTEQVSYRGPQRSALQGALHTDADFRNLYRRNRERGMDQRAAYEKAANTIFDDPRKAAAMEKRVADWAGQYYHLNGLEQKLTAVIPFYTWDRHALRFGKEQVLSRPVQSIVLSQLGALGDEAADRELGKIPDFMKGAIPVRGHDSGILGFLLGQNILGRKKVLLTAGLNPLAAAADNAAAVAALFGQGPRDPSEAVGGQVNPIVSGFIAGVTGQRLFSGARAETHGAGPAGGIVQESFLELPHGKLIKQLLGEEPDTTTSQGGETLYVKGMRQTISSLMGLNERDFSPEAAERLYNQDHGIKKGRRRKKREAKTMASQLKSNF